MEDKFKIGDFVEFTPDDLGKTYKGVIKDITLYTYFIESRTYGNAYISKNRVNAINNLKTK